MQCYFMVDLFRVKKLTKMSENVASGVLSGVVKVSGFFTSSIVNSKVGKKFFSLLPGEIILASLDGFSKFISDYLLFLIC
jgi:spartin